eukprot:CAMPEP_0113305886 /NCGR_PEP_ID=MMETSP0010_2-20120614/5353_1 /TAXON_ID=216773 ORGANISM="Corethron hystrix, Strain 308" /NCGR_SAMPLE_ID=MMETSP0010_2 /ASSEMBLY_ACC=CAM_ASM_000155 /LENGTH=67 /DNA_ID=CAMNT_0000160433 /DNA_START=35 /DNA_END=234 /DNA_ORIENTATION=+ /assembly_acc=CAM_ASM_000155
MKLFGALLLVGQAAAFSNFQGAKVQHRMSARDAKLSMATGMGVNGFGRIGRLVTRIMMDDPDVECNA